MSARGLSGTFAGSVRPLPQPITNNTEAMPTDSGIIQGGFNAHSWEDPPGDRPENYNLGVLIRSEENGRDDGPVRKAVHSHSCGEVELQCKYDSRVTLQEGVRKS
jgi:hypothetical protein